MSELNLLIKAQVIGKEMTVLGDPEIICSNTDYKLEIEFDSSWDGQNLKTVRFVAVSEKKTTPYDVVIKDTNIVNVPKICNADSIFVGVFAGDSYATTKAGISCKKSILCGSGDPVEPTPDVYAQIMELFNNVHGESAFIRFSSSPDGSDFTEEWVEGQRYIGFATALLAPVDKSAFTWVEFVPNVEEIARAEKAASDAETATSRTNQAIKNANEAAELAESAASGVVTIEQNSGSKLKFWVGTQAEYDALTSIVPGCFYIISDDPSFEEIYNMIVSAHNRITEIEDKVGRSLFLEAPAKVSRSKFFKDPGYYYVKVGFLGSEDIISYNCGLIFWSPDVRVRVNLGEYFLVIEKSGVATVYKGSIDDELNASDWSDVFSIFASKIGSIIETETEVKE